jgi:hypothetical protein
MRLFAALVLPAVLAGTAHAQSAGRSSIALAAPDATLPAEFTLATSVRELSDRRLLVVDRSEKTLFVVDWTKGTVGPLGRNGSGPGEYVQPGALLALAGDSTLLSDVGSGRWLVLHGASIAGTIGPDAPAIVSGARQPVGADRQGHVIATRPVGAQANDPTARPRLDSLLLLRISRATGRSDTVAVLRARPATIKVQGPAGRPTSISVTRNPLAAGEAAALFPDGWIAIARMEPYRVDWRAPDGRVVRGSPLPFERVRLNEREQRAVLEREATRTGRPERDPKAVPDWPEIMPPFLWESLLPAPDGRLWIRRPPTADDPHPPYDVVDRRGALVARVRAGADVRVVGFGRASMYTVLTDENGIQRLQRRPLPAL